MTRIDEAIAAAWQARRFWGGDDLEQLLSCLRTRLPAGQTELDKKSGENWARVIMNGEVALLISVICPLVIVLDQYCCVIAELDSRAIVVSVHSMDAREFAASRESVALLRGSEPDEIDFGGFSMQELWWATV